MKKYLQELEKIFLEKGIYADRDFSADDFTFKVDDMDSVQEILSIVERYQSNYMTTTKLFFDRTETALGTYFEYEFIDRQTAKMILIDVVMYK